MRLDRRWITTIDGSTWILADQPDGQTALIVASNRSPSRTIGAVISEIVSEIHDLRADLAHERSERAAAEDACARMDAWITMAKAAGTRLEPTGDPDVQLHG